MRRSGLTPGDRRPSRRRVLVFAALVTLLVLELGARAAPAAWWEAGLFKDHWLDARIGRAIARSVNTATEPASGDLPGQGSDARPEPRRVLSPGVRDAAGILKDAHTYNGNGYRGADWPAPRPGVRRVAVVGDSRVFGLYVEESETIAARISARDGWEGLNVGVTGAGTFEILDYILDDALDAHPDAVVVLADINPSVLTLVPAARWSPRGSIGQILRGSALLRRGEILARHAIAGVDGRVPSVPEDAFAAEVGQILDRVRGAGVERTLVVIGVTALPDRDGLFSRARYDRYRMLARQVSAQRGVPALELAPLLADLPREEAYRGVGIHWSPLALDRIAGAVVTALESPPP